MKQWLLVGLLLTLTFAGCLDDDDASADASDDTMTGDEEAADERQLQTVQFAKNGQFAGHVEDHTLDCDEDGTLGVMVNGQGRLLFTVTDANGTVIREYEFNGQSSEAHQSDLSGAAGTWTITITAGDENPLPLQPPAFQGQYAGEMTC